MTTVAIHQPQYLPWLAYIDKADAVDVFVYLDNVSYQKNGVQNRNLIKTASGPNWLTVPVSATLGRAISETPVAGNSWVRKHVRSIEQNYSKAAHFELFQSGLRQILEQDWKLLADLNIAVTEWLFGVLGVKTRIVRASQLAADGTAQDRVLAICKELDAQVYLSGRGAASYQTFAEFERAGIELRYQDFTHPIYHQAFEKIGFVPDLSALDLLLNHGPEARRILLSGRQERTKP